MAIPTTTGYELGFESAGEGVPEFIKQLDEQSFGFEIANQAYTLSINLTRLNQQMWLNFFVDQDYRNHGGIIIDANTSLEQLSSQIQTQLSQNFEVDQAEVSLNLSQPIDWSERY